MKSMFHRTIAVAAIAAQLGTIVLADSSDLVPVNINSNSAVDIVLFAAVNDGKTLTRTNAHGHGAFSASDVADLGKLDVVEDKCSEATRVLLVAPNTYVSNPDNCKRRRIGAFWWGHDDELNVKLSGGMGAGTKTALWIGAGIGAAVVAKIIYDEMDKKVPAIATKPAASSPTTPVATQTTPVATPQTAPPPPPNLASLFGNFNITATKTTDTGCNFNQTFTGQVQVSGNGDQVTVKMVERLTRVYTGTLRSDGTFSATGGGNMGTLNYTGIVSGQISGNSIQGTEQMSFTSGCPDRQVAYHFNGTRN